MKVEIWSDYACPFCYIGKRRFEEALAQFAHKDKVEVIYRSFELDPDSPRDVEHDIYERLSSKYGMSREQAMGTTRDVARQAESVGLDYHFDTMILTNTFDSHRLTHFAAREGKMEEMTERLLKAHFTESKHIGDHETLTELGVDVGLDREAVAAMLTGDDFTAEVRADEQEAMELGVRGVPFFVLNRKYAVSGAQPAEVFVQALNQAWSEISPLTILNGQDGDATDGAICADGVCTPPAEKE